MSRLTKNRLDTLFERKKSGILSVYYTAGAPHLESTVSVARSLAAAGADLIEIGIPFSDPVADGPVIQASNKTALQNGMNVRRLLEQVRELRMQSDIPVILMGYCNPVLRFGFEAFCVECARAGVDGLILPDLPPEEYAPYKLVADAHGLATIFLVSPTSSTNRIRQVDELSSPFVYAVSSSSTTGARESFSEEQVWYFSRLKSMGLRNPLLIGFGISNHAAFSTACEFAAGAVVGSAFISCLNESVRPEDITTFVRGMKGALVT